jgi:hypothetical protein
MASKSIKGSKNHIIKVNYTKLTIANCRLPIAIFWQDFLLNYF